MNDSLLLQPEEIQPAVDQTTRLMEELNRILLGRDQLHRLVLVGILSRGHILLEGLPGVGKTALVKALGGLMNLDFNRVQFTPDLMPGDILGTNILQTRSDGQREMEFQAGPIFTNILLADEINRASPKTQSAMLEAMQERSVTLLGSTRPLPDPFFVLASQNPIELEGTYPLPEAQLDRFLFKLQVGEVDVSVLEQIIGTRRQGQPPESVWSLNPDALAHLYEVMEKIFLPKRVGRFIGELVAATHPDSESAPASVQSFVTYGASPRAAIGMAEAARAHALISGRPTVGFEDVRAIAPHVLNHRLVLNYKSRFEKVDAFAIVDDVLEAVGQSAMDLPQGMETKAV
ncbi:MAG: AAA family ATPase [Phycisphaeraceae bacterium]|nr:AAA family ATPase [Phycisphaeraceae bacterium]